MRVNDRKAVQEAKGKEMDAKEKQLRHHIELFNKEFGYDFELVRKTQVRQYRDIIVKLKATVSTACESVINLHPWLKNDK